MSNIKSSITVEKVDGSKEMCSFHISRDNNKIIEDKILYRISYGYDKNSTHSMIICDKCWNKLVVLVDLERIYRELG